jgi:hypothetical protein
MSDFLPEGYEAPVSGGAYMKLEQGENRFRILSKPIVGWLDWKDNKPYRFPMNKKPEKPMEADRKIKHFWAFIVWNCNRNEVQILEVTQSSIQAAITALTKDQDWGTPYNYDIKVTKTGTSLETEYTVAPAPHKPVDPLAVDAANKKPIYLDALYAGEDPFADHGGKITPIENAMPF